ncbi:MAG: virulence RhuM family protein [Bacteroidetes bacterium]|jgi:hypothetical protein|nr:virulence RhuM family protein [Bacteroidota bacterium]
MKEVVIYQTQSGSLELKGDYANQTIWATSSKMELVQMEAGRQVKRKVDYYNLEMIISVGYRINTVKGTKFRQWDTKCLKYYLPTIYLSA